MIGTWGYYETNENGQAVAFAPAMTGDINITESDTTPGEFTIDYVLTDDNIDEPHTMTAHFVGTFDISDHTGSDAAVTGLAIPDGNGMAAAPVTAPESRIMHTGSSLKAAQR